MCLMFTLKIRDEIEDMQKKDISMRKHQHTTNVLHQYAYMYQGKYFLP